MPSRPCGWPTCTAYVAGRDRYCPEHAGKAPASAEKHRRYDTERRDRLAKAFYDGPAWGRMRARKLASAPVCERCGSVWARHVHHVRPIRTHPELRLTMSNLMALCVPCHTTVEKEAAG